VFLDEGDNFHGEPLLFAVFGERESW
jgi:hypothetical protein